MEFTASQIAIFLQGTVEGNPEITVSNLSKIEEGTPGTMTFLSNPKYTQYIYKTKASVVVVNNDFVPAEPISATLIRVPSAYEAFARLLEMYGQLTEGALEISDQAYISSTAKLGEQVGIGAFAFIGDHAKIGNHVRIYPQVYIGDRVMIGDNTILYPGVKVYRDCIIGNECTLHSGAVIGADGFGFVPQSDTNYKKIPQIGNVIIEDCVEIGANTTIDRATLGSTLIRKGVKLDNQIQVAHNVEIGENTVIAAQVGISGSTKIGKNCMIAGQVGFAGHIVIADNVKIGAQSGVENSILKEGIYLGAPAIEYGRARRSYIHWRNFDDIVKRIQELEKKMKSHE
jgi:UDP-3-O-[3-hydroxymyristoyl] glucosamine N-acyltransferase